MSITRRESEEIASTTCIFEVHVRQPGFKKKMSPWKFLSALGALERVDPSVIAVSKELIQKIDIAYLETARNDYLARIKSLAVPSGGLNLGNGQHLIKLESVEKAKKLTEDFEKERQRLLNDFENSYEFLKNKAKGLLKEFYQESDFPPFNQIRSRYSVEYKFISNAVPEELKKISEKIYNEEVLKRRQEMRMHAEVLQVYLRESFYQLAKTLSSAVGKNPETGKFRRLPEAKVREIQEFIAKFYSSTLIQDQELEGLVEKAKQALGDISLSEMATDLEFRDNIANTFADIVEEVEVNMTEVQRAIRLPE